MKINYNKRSSFLQGSGDLIEEVYRTLQMVNGINAENQVKRVILGREGVGRAYLKFNSVTDSVFNRIPLRKVNHHPGEIDSLKLNPRDCFCHKDGENSRTRSDIDGPSLSDPLCHDPLQNPPAGKGHVPSGHLVVIFCEFPILDDPRF